MFGSFKNYVNKQSSDGNRFNEGIRNVQVGQRRYVFQVLPQNAAQLKTIDRSGEEGKYLVLALLPACFKMWTPQNPEVCYDMMKVLMNSPTLASTPPFNNFTKDFVRARMMQNGKWAYIGNAYYEGAAPQNGYTPNQPYAITVREYVYAPQISTIYGKQLSVEKVVIEFAGADTERQLSVYQDPQDHQWYIWSDSYGGFLADVKTPMR